MSKHHENRKKKNSILDFESPKIVARVTRSYVPSRITPSLPFPRSPFLRFKSSCKAKHCVQDVQRFRRAGVNVKVQYTHTHTHIRVLRWSILLDVLVFGWQWRALRRNCPPHCADKRNGRRLTFDEISSAGFSQPQRFPATPSHA